jgi:FlgD Ig-like domain
MPRGSHASIHARPVRPGTRPRSRARARRYAWFAVLTAFALLGAAAITFGASRQGARLASDSAGGPLFGGSASDPALLARATSEFGHMPIIRVYYPGLPRADAWTTGAPGVNRSAVIVSFNGLPKEILSGADDSALSHFFHTAPTGHPIYYSYYPEPENAIAAGQFTLAGFKSAWAHLVLLADAAHNPNLRSTLILTNWDLSPQSGRNWKAYLPTGGVISTLGWDAYPAGTVHNKNPQLTPPSEFMGPEVAASKSVGLPFGFAEFGLGRVDGRPRWLTEVANYLANSGALFGTYFNSTAWPTIELSDAASIAVWRSVVAGSGRHTPGPTPSAPSTAQAAALQVTGLSLHPAAFIARGRRHVTITFTLSQRADITVCILDHQGSLVRDLAQPNRAAGPVTISYYGYDHTGQRDSAGSYPVLVVASNAHGSATAEATLTITSLHG